MKIFVASIQVKYGFLAYHGTCPNNWGVPEVERLVEAEHSKEHPYASVESVSVEFPDERCRTHVELIGSYVE